MGSASLLMAPPTMANGSEAPGAQCLSFTVVHSSTASYCFSCLTLLHLPYIALLQLPCTAPFVLRRPASVGLHCSNYLASHCFRQLALLHLPWRRMMQVRAVAAPDSTPTIQGHQKGAACNNGFLSRRYSAVHRHTLLHMPAVSYILLSRMHVCAFCSPCCVCVPLSLTIHHVHPARDAIHSKLARKSITAISLNQSAKVMNTLKTHDDMQPSLCV